MTMERLTISGERLVMPVWDGAVLGPVRWKRQTMRFTAHRRGWQRRGLVYPTRDAALLAAWMGYRVWRATLAQDGPRGVILTRFRGGNLAADLIEQAEYGRAMGLDSDGVVTTRGV